MTCYISSVKNLYTLALHFLVIMSFLVLGSCKCKDPKLSAKKENHIQRGPTPAHLLLSSSKSSLEDNQTNFEILIKNEGETIADLHEYILKISLQEQGGTGTTLDYQDTSNTWQHAASIEKPLSHFVNQKTLQQSDSPLVIPFQVIPSPSVKKGVIILMLEHRDKKDNLLPISVSWDYSPITNKMINLAKNQGYVFLAEALTRFKAGEVININNPTPKAALHEAAKLGDLNIFNALLKIGANMDIEDLLGNTPLHFAALHGHLPIVQKLIEKGGNLNAKTKDKQTPLLIATKSHQVAVAKALIQKLIPEQLNESNTDGETALYWASKKQQKEITDELLKKLDLSKVQEKNDQDQVILRWAIGQKLTPLALAMIHNSNILQLISHDGYTSPLEQAFLLDQEAVCLKLIEKLDVTQLNTQGHLLRQTPLHWAVIHNNEAIVRLLINKGVDKNITDSQGKKPFDLARTQEIKDLLTSP